MIDCKTIDKSWNQSIVKSKHRKQHHTLTGNLDYGMKSFEQRMGLLCRHTHTIELGFLRLTDDLHAFTYLNVSQKWAKPIRKAGPKDVEG